MLLSRTFPVVFNYYCEEWLEESRATGGPRPASGLPV
jgi:hypothetical protein